ncbi:hypothetical protein COU78_00075 [Candidatus Peregrinibacteria bacterium CG10_big_fil_rev_8_21_14_0_10_49_24]|nr:MAG: hypothetical protein COV83_06120 [Candidatus Peregrinibacteria bacterium CG11_big_fil_rev_8_21_14_0_20_49_14]PIR51585.1 MAG: hypothetical protein COU78_00075 [Candidatus Peregrinibacteria bacterium CG10_big_fil_rev_8_21_14_0_10_49_24]PJA68053.1 MAG: hypothetical protein CO157_01890 [Candidatus Peregrinibacteria bacterium CG_4_9_14_3_um_filter_49_12]
MRIALNKTTLSLPIVRRSAFCKSVSLVMGIAIAISLPAPLVQQVPMVQAAAIINALIIGVMIALAGVLVWQPVLNGRFHPVLRGGVLAAFVHLDFIIYLWPDQSLFWQTILFAAVYGALLDYFATRLFGEGMVLAKDMQPPTAL